ncbi:MAG: cysteine desulfurase family protein [Candidatus Paceibacterota bacterium]
MEQDNENKKRIYLDYASTTPLDDETLKFMLPYFNGEYSNPSSMHQSGRDAMTVIVKSKKEIAEVIGVRSDEIIFTGSGTESDNLAILGVCRAYKNKGNHIIISAIEHKAILEPAKQLEKEGFVVSVLPVDKEGKINVDECVKLITPKTILISIMYANNEIGTVEPIKELSKCIASLKNNEGMPFLHTDACQATGYLSINVPELGVDLMTLNSSKIYGPKGVGLLYKKHSIKIDPVISGGEQEYSLRAGTENIALIAGFTHALKKAEDHREEEVKRLQHLQSFFMLSIKMLLPYAKFNGPLPITISPETPLTRLPNNVHISIPAVEGESMVLMLDHEGIEVATGSACSSLDLKPSHVLIAIGQDPEIIHGSIRFTLGRHTTKQELEKVLEIFPKVVKHLTSLSSIKI